MDKKNNLAMNPIDAVITWVDGNSERHRQRRLHHMSKERTALHENAINPHRWECNDEIIYCLKSIANHAPWVRTIWIVVDEEVPDLSSLPDSLRRKILIAYHHEIFASFQDALPTFNSLAIESMIWRIGGLSERFLYFNDDVFLTAPLQPTDVFAGNAPVLRGKWANYASIVSDPNADKDPSLFNHFMQINAAKMLCFKETHLFAAAHVVHPFLCSKMEHLFSKFPDAFKNNITHRFRDLSQFLPQGLHNHACINDGCVVLNLEEDHTHIWSGIGLTSSSGDTHALLKSASEHQVKFLCVNDLPQLEKIIPNVRTLISRAVTPKIS